MQIDLDVNESYLIRTDFSNDETWRTVQAAASAPQQPEGFRAFLTFIDDRRFEGATVEVLLQTVRGPGFVFVADSLTISDPEHPILALDFGDPDPEFPQPGGQTFRVLPSEIIGPEANLRLGNMYFEEFAEAVDSDGVFRGFGPRDQ